MSTYTLGPGDVGSTIDVVVTATNSAGATTVVSAPTAVVASTGSAPADISPPTIAGTPSQGQTLTASSGAWNGVPAPAFAYQWSDCDQSGQNCSALQGATSQTYTVTAANIGSTIEVVLTASNSAGTTSASSAPSATVQALSQAPQNTTPPTMSGTASEGQTLTVSPGTWSGSPTPTLSDQWQRCGGSGGGCTAIAGATSKSYTAIAADVGATLEVIETADQHRRNGDLDVCADCGRDHGERSGHSAA